MLRFTLFGFPVRVEPWFWAIGCLLGYGLLNSDNPRAMQFLAIWVAVFFVSILWHELGHAFAMRRYGSRPDILLYGMGGLCRGTGHFTRQQSIIISAAGPGAGFILALIALGLNYTPLAANRMLAFGIHQLIWVNTFWTLMNLLPVLPLDGGNILRAFLANRNPTAAPKIGAVVAGIVSILGLISRQPWIAILFGFLAYQNWKMTQAYPGQRPF